MELFDTHCHFSGEGSPAEFQALIASALAASPQKELGQIERLSLTVCGCDYVESLRAREFAAVVPDAVFAAGVHPQQAADYLTRREDFSVFRDHPKLAAVGELGLDYYYEPVDRAAQIQVLERFLALALEWRLPAILHLRDKDGVFAAYDDALALLPDFVRSGGAFAVHSFTGTPEYARKFLELGAYYGVNGLVTFKRADNVRESLRVVPADRLLLETDAPYLAPVPHRGKVNHPGYLPLIAAKVAAEKGLELEELARITTDNARRFFHLPEKEELS